MSVHVSIHLSSATYSRKAFDSGLDQFGVLYVDAKRDVALVGTEEQLRALADELLVLADDVAYESRGVSA